METPYRCPLLRGCIGREASCQFTGERVDCSIACKCDDLSRGYMACEYFSLWYWEGAKRRQKLPEILNKKEVMKDATSQRSDPAL